MPVIETLKKSIAIKALVVDDDEENRLILDKMLTNYGYDVLQAENGLVAVELFSSAKPDIIFMDVKMPIMDGYQATREIKALSQNDFIPVIFITALDKQEDLEACIQAGGDDFLSKPFDMTILKSKIHWLERIRGIYRRVNELNQTLSADNHISDNVFKQAIYAKNTHIEAIKTWFKNDGQTNNDIFLVKHNPANCLNILLGNFNTRGPASAVGALPCSEVFRSMTEKGFSAKDIIEGINQKLIDILPTGIHMSAIFLSINNELNQVQICNLSMPDVYIVSDQTKAIIQTIGTQEKLLGNETHLDGHNLIETIQINKSSRIILSGNGVINSKNVTFENYGPDRYQKTVEKGIQSENVIEQIKTDLNAFTQSSYNTQTLSVIEIPCTFELCPRPLQIITDIENHKHKNKVSINPNASINFELTINGKNLKRIDPVPTIINFLQEVASIKNHKESLFTIFTELYVNALEHGILGLESSLKNTSNGFEKYFQEKEKKLQALDSGSIKIKLALDSSEKINRLLIFMEDSGPGFDFQKSDTQKLNSSSLLSGRGITLVRALCDSFEFHHKGNQCTSTYTWPIE